MPEVNVTAAKYAWFECGLVVIMLTCVLVCISVSSAIVPMVLNSYGACHFPMHVRR